MVHAAAVTVSASPSVVGAGWNLLASLVCSHYKNGMILMIMQGVEQTKSSPHLHGNLEILPAFRALNNLHQYKNE